ncbi:MAG: DUF3570 domain-containing protein [Thermoanaerobaculia bacterium]|jgi:hypothetical protein|nr:DUF3570 domain-containing protein [Thermoanaerobaculia bacterium]MBP9824950.1 DUF3570 domain-containing protein [Thermoanaerobaculia bacterium]
MQLNRDNSVRLALAAATGVLLGCPAAQADGWSFDSQVLYYSETNRVTAIEPVVSARWDRGDGKALNFRLTVDSLTGASANGATPSSRAQTYTTPSGHGSYATQPGETPLDTSFLDTRWALNMSWEKPLSPLWKATFGANVSTEYDYGSYSVNAVLARDFNQRNTTLSLGAALGYDTVDPVGGLPEPLGSMSPEVPGGGEDDGGGVPPLNRIGSGDTKSLYDLLFGLTQILDRRSLVQINYSVGRSSGYLTDPYKLVSLIDPLPGPNQGNPVDQLYESRPDARTKQSLYVAYKRQMRSEDAADVSYRYHWDDWRIRSHTIDLRYRWDLGGAGYLQPHARLYQQSAASFYTRYLAAGEALPGHASADYRLGDLTGVTFGLKYGRPMRHDREWNIKLEYYEQSGTVSGAQPGVLADYELFPAVDALMVQFGCAF